MAEAPRPGVSRRAAAEEWAIKVHVDGIVHTVRPAELSALDARACRLETGFRISQLTHMTEEELGFDIDVTAALVWLARRQSGETISFEDVAKSITYESDFSRTGTEPEKDPDDPEA